MTTAVLADRVREILVELVGEQFGSSEAGNDVVFTTLFNGVHVRLDVEPFGSDGAIVAGFHVLGAAVEDREAAMRFVVSENMRLRVGRYFLTDDVVVFCAHLFQDGVNTATVRSLFALLAGESRKLPALAAATGALSLEDAAALAELDE